MAVTDSHGTVTAAGSGAEDTLFNSTAAGTYTMDVDTNAMVAGDILELRIYKMVLTSGTARVAYYARYDGVQPADDKIKISVPISTALTDTGALSFRLTQSGAGTDKAFPWAVLKYA